MRVTVSRSIIWGKSSSTSVFRSVSEIGGDVLPDAETERRAISRSVVVVVLFLRVQLPQPPATVVVSVVH